jgi:hypothetical protein
LWTKHRVIRVNLWLSPLPHIRVHPSVYPPWRRKLSEFLASRIKEKSFRPVSHSSKDEPLQRAIDGRPLREEPACYRASMPYKRIVSKRKIMRIFLLGMLFGVIITAAVTYQFAIPANSDYWRMEIWKRGGAAWTSDKTGHIGWRWMVDPLPDRPIPATRAVVPPSELNPRIERL